MSEEELKMELIEFNGDRVSINVVLHKKEIEMLKDVWFNKVDSCQPPLIEAHKNGFNLHIPWIMKGKSGDA